jgi:hypothetical protein
MTIGNRVVLILAALLLAATNLNAQHRWNGKEKHWYKDWLWWIGEGFIAGTFVADAHSTALVRDRCPACEETNPFLGPHPSNRAIVVYSGIVFAAFTGFHILAEEWCPNPNGESKVWRTVCYTTIPAIAASRKIPAAIHNYHLAARLGSESTQSFSTSTLARAQSISGHLTDAGTRSWTAQRYGDRPFFLSKGLSGCRNSLTLCTPIPPTTESKVDLRSVQFR